MEPIVLPTLTCQKCGYTWIPRKPDPKNCANPKCRCPKWNRYDQIRPYKRVKDL